jgi:hypothetical protein
MQSRPRRLLRHAATASGAWLCLSLAASSGSLAGDKRWFEGGDKVFIRQHDDFVRVQEPDIHLQRAHRRFAKGLKVGAADELEKAAAGFSYFAERAAGDARKELSLASRALNKLADQTRRGDVGEITELERAIADAQRILAGEPKPVTVAPPPPAEPTPPR